MKRLYLDIEDNAAGQYSPDHKLTLMGVKEKNGPYRSYLPHEIKDCPELRDPSVTKVGWNFAYDVTGLEKAGIKMEGPVEDIGLAYRLMDERWPRSMENTLSKIGISPHKWMRRTWEAEGYTWATVPMDRLRPYNVLDLHRTEDLDKWIQGKYNLRQYEFLQATSGAVRQMKNRGAQFDHEVYTKLEGEFEKNMQALEQKLLKHSKINWRSNRQIGEFLTDKGHKLKHTPTGEYKVDSQTLKSLKKSKVVDLLLEFRKASKLYKTYLIGMRKKLHLDGRFHSEVDVMGARTGRMSYSKPNLQNLPKNSPLRQLIVSKFKGGILQANDWNQLELVLMAIEANDLVLQDEILGGVDVHARSGERLGIERGDGKSANFLVRYGGRAGLIAWKWKIPFEDAKAFIDWTYSHYPALRRYHHEKALSTQTGVVSSRFGRVRHTTNLNEIYNHPIQSMASDLNKMVLIRVMELGKGYQSHPIIEIHDELVFDVHPKEVEEYHKNVIVPAYAGINEQVVRWFGAEASLPLPLAFSTKRGKNFHQMEDIHG